MSDFGMFTAVNKFCVRHNYNLSSFNIFLSLFIPKIIIRIKINLEIMDNHFALFISTQNGNNM